jgi:hypothetical protein
LFEFDRDQRELLADVVMQVSSDPLTFSLLRSNQFASYSSKSFLCALSISDVTGNSSHSHYRAT